MSRGRTSRPIVVGYDGSAAGRAALEWALAEAEDVDRPVRCVIAMPPLYEPAPLAGVLAALPDEMGDRLGREVRAYAESHRPRVSLHTATVIGGAAGVLVDASRDADLLVVGRGRHRALGEVFTGSTSTQVIAHAHCPVVAVEAGQHHHPGPIVVGFDGSPKGQAALAYAFDVATARNAPLSIVHAWWVDYCYPEAFGQVGMEAGIVDQVEEHERGLLDRAVGEWTAKYPNVSVTATLARNRPIEAVLDAAGEAQLIVVGSRGLGGFAGLVLGSTSQGLLHRTRPCPLVVVHPR